MIEAAAAVGATPSPVGPQIDTVAAASSGGTASMVQAGEFARAVAAPQEVPAAPPVADAGLADRLSHQADAIMAHLRASGSAGPVPPDGVGGGNVPRATETGLDRAKANEAVDQMERAYMFAIETTMASRGSTETTKIFNTLLKGQ